MKKIEKLIIFTVSLISTWTKDENPDVNKKCKNR